MEVVDIDADDVLVRDYGLRIPVVLLAGEPIAEGTVDTLALWRSLVKARFGG